jgi:hypothetical protein
MRIIFTHSMAQPGVSGRQPASSRAPVQTLGIPSGKNFDLPWDFLGGKKSCGNRRNPG